MKDIYVKLVIFHLIFYPLFAWFVSYSVEPKYSDFSFYNILIIGFLSAILTAVRPYIKAHKESKQSFKK